MKNEDGHNGPAQMALVQFDTLDALMEEVRTLRTLLERGAIDSRDSIEYVEPGPHSERKFFTATELATRWKWGKTKVYELTEEELPSFKRGQLVRFFWAHVWAFEGRISQETSNAIWKAHAVQASAQSELSHPHPEPARIRPLP